MLYENISRSSCPARHRPKDILLEEGSKNRPSRCGEALHWNPNRHEIITDEEKYPKIKVTLKPEKKYTDPTTGKEHVEPEQKKLVDPNRIALPIEQDIVNIQTAFTVGTEPVLDCKPEQSEEGLLSALKQVFKKNKIKYQNKKAVRAWLAEQEVAEYWYVVRDDGFWAKLKRKVAEIFGQSQPEYRLKSVLWSPFRGDKLYPFRSLMTWEISWLFHVSISGRT